MEKTTVAVVGFGREVTSSTVLSLHAWLPAWQKTHSARRNFRNFEEAGAPFIIDRGSFLPCSYSFRDHFLSRTGKNGRLKVELSIFRRTSTNRMMTFPPVSSIFPPFSTTFLLRFYDFSTTFPPSPRASPRASYSARKTVSSNREQLHLGFLQAL